MEDSVRRIKNDNYHMVGPGTNDKSIDYQLVNGTYQSMNI